MSAERATYIDSSGLVKLVVIEEGSEALRAALRGWGPLVTSAIARTEVRRALRRAGLRDEGRSARVLQGAGLVRVSDEVLDRAGTLPPPTLRSLDAIHLATAALLGSDLEQLCTYDLRMATAAEAAGITVVSPGAAA